MLTSFRQFAQSPVALVIILLLVMGFALYGVGGIFTGSGTAVVVVGQQQISQRELARAYQRELDRITDHNRFAVDRVFNRQPILRNNLWFLRCTSCQKKESHTKTAKQAKALSSPFALFAGFCY